MDTNAPQPGPTAIETKRAAKSAERAVPCGTCNFCCRKEWIFLDPAAGDMIDLYDTEDAVHPVTKRMTKALAHKPNGDCIYLGDKGCTIHPRRPHLCRAFDCRVLYLEMLKKPRIERRNLLRDQANEREGFEIGKAMQKKHPL